MPWTVNDMLEPVRGLAHELEQQSDDGAVALLTVGTDLVSYFGYVPVPDASAHELLDALLNDAPGSDHAIVKAFWTSQMGEVVFDAFWQKAR